jgi:regulator of nonsense transcripts 2
MVKYLGELYNYKVVSSNIIFDTLYTLIFFGHRKGRAYPDQIATIDPPTDSFRIRLVCMLLDTCGRFFNRGPSKTRLDHFLVFFQGYVLCKDKEAMPLDVDFMISDTLEALRPQLKRFETFAEADAEIGIIERDVFAHLADVTGSAEFEKVENERDENSETASDEGDSSSDDDGKLDEPVGDDDAVDFDANRPRSVEETEEDHMFTQEFQKMMTESMESRRNEKRAAVLDFALPMQLKKGVSGYDDHSANVGSNFQFTLLTKKKNKVATKTIGVPVDSPWVTNALSNQDAARQERRQLKEMVLGLEQQASSVGQHIPPVSEFRGNRPLRPHGASGSNTPR